MAFFMRNSADDVSNRFQFITYPNSPWTLQEYQLSTCFKGSGGPINCLAFSRDGIFLASGGM